MRPADVTLSRRDEALLRVAIALSREARGVGDEPYGALLADVHGNILAKARNTQVSGRDCIGHAELNLMRDTSAHWTRDQLASCTVYASGEPCPMCAGAIYWAGVGRVVYGFSIETVTELSGGDAADELALHCREVLVSGTRAVEVIGPALEPVARRVFKQSAPVSLTP